MQHETQQSISLVSGEGQYHVTRLNLMEDDLTSHAAPRICAGRHFAEASLLIYCASILHVFNIRPPFDEHGVPTKLKYRATDGMVSYVLRFHSGIF